MLQDITTYGKMNCQQLMEELAEVSAVLSTRLRELGGLRADYNREFYPQYFRTPGNSVAAKEKEATYECLDIVNDITLIEQDIAALTVAKECLTVILSHWNHASAG